MSDCLLSIKNWSTYKSTEMEGAEKADLNFMIHCTLATGNTPYVWSRKSMKIEAIKSSEIGHHLFVSNLRWDVSVLPQQSALISNLVLCIVGLPWHPALIKDYELYPIYTNKSQSLVLNLHGLPIVTIPSVCIPKYSDVPG